MKIRDVMTKDVHLARPADTIQDVASRMAKGDFGFVPVADGDQLIGTITDRDIVVRAVAGGLGPDTPVREVMSTEVKYCFDDEDIDAAARNMAQQQVRRLPVLDRDKRLVGIVSLADLVAAGQTEKAGEALGGIVRPGGEHSQATQ